MFYEVAYLIKYILQEASTFKSESENTWGNHFQDLFIQNVSAFQ